MTTRLMNATILPAKYVISACLLLMTMPVHAYIGPGAGLSAIGTLVALIGAVLLAIVGFLWYPIKRMMRNRKNRESSTESSDNKESGS